MATITNEFHVPVKQPEPFKVRVVTALVQFNEVYKGEFETVAELNKISAYAGDYADVYETNTRWVFINDAWSNSEQAIPINPTLATKQDVDTLSERVTGIEQAVTEELTEIKTSLAEKADKTYVDELAVGVLTKEQVDSLF